MDPRFSGFPASVNGIQSISTFSDRNLNGPRFDTVHPTPPPPGHNLVNGPRNGGVTFIQRNFGGVQFLPNDPPSAGNITSNSSLDPEDDCSEDLDFSDAVLRYINQILMEEDMEDKTYMLQESLGLQAKEKSFYEALGKKYPPSPEPPDPTFLSQDGSTPDEYFFPDQYNITTTSGNGRSCVVDPTWTTNAADFDSTSLVQWVSPRNVSNSSVSSSNSINNLVDGFLDSPASSLHIPDESHSVWNFRKGVEEASKFLPDGNKLLSFSTPLPWEVKGETDAVAVKPEGKDEGDVLSIVSRGRKNPPDRDFDLEEERSSKQAAVYTESTIRSEEFDIVLLHSMGKGQEALEAYRENLQTAKSKNVRQNGHTKGPSGGKGRGKKQNGKKEVVDLRTLLIHCAQAVAADDRRNANELLKQIRQHSSPFGDGNQRLSHCFADGLEARLAGTGSQIYKALVNKRTSAASFLKAYHLYLASCPFRKISSFASNKTIMIKAENATRVHVIDFGILYGFQWPTFIQRIAGRKGGPPRLRITGIEFPQPGFRPAEQIEETGRRLTEYAKMFDVPFDYNPVAKKWETITLEDLKIQEDEFIVVNSIYRFKNLLDETVLVDSSRTVVLNLIRKINPNFFIHGIVNGAYSAPFFVTRFREALFHFSALFDMLETNVPREIPERMLIEKEIFGREALNVIACEGWERVERPETYKQWQVRYLRAGFKQIPFEQSISSRALEKVTKGYHKDFVIDEDNNWLLLGWKGRIIYGLSCWQPV
ncbi:hypothetical protein M9H77_03641 [Catharanthus roseus]|uniref:Uncharacterized protein n=1 Tax=Catharanthus roseus TaxID=4058 RepID=A0ACC0CC87_CATRO|nr:hypothetical protein M9H77_03641 [Catharanthus roseus]